MSKQQSNGRIWIVLIIVVTAAALLLAACPTEPPGDEESGEESDNGEDETIAVTGVTLDKASVTIPFGGTEQLTATVEPADATDTSVSWSSDNDSVATVDADGLVTGIAEGTATVTVTTTDGGFTAECAVTVTAATEDGGFASASIPGNTGTLTLASSGESLRMVYAQDQTSISFPTGTDDGTPATLTTKFFVAEAETTNAIVAAVLQWAYDDDWFSSSGHNELSTTTVKYGNQELLDLDDGSCRVEYDGSGNFSPENGYRNHPVTNITWYGAIMFCNWLTEMRDGDTDNVVYTEIDTSWQDDETEEDREKNGYRLPTSNECEYAARYLGKTEPATGDDLDIECKYGNDDPSWTDSYYWTPGDYASGATADYYDGPACQAVAIYSYTGDPYGGEQEVKSLGIGSANILGIYDISGNVWEWCFTEDGNMRVLYGGSYANDNNFLRVGIEGHDPPNVGDNHVGFRVCRTAD